MKISRRAFIKFGVAAAAAPGMLPLKPQSSAYKNVTIKVLGVAQDGGLPQIGCSCERCSAALIDPAKRRFVACLGIISPSGKTYLIDATPDIKAQVVMLNSGVNRANSNSRNPVDGIFLTHAHMGHYTGLMHLGFESVSSSEIPVYCSGKMSDYLNGNGPWSQLVNYKNILIKEFEYDKPVEPDSEFEVIPFRVPHRQEYTDTAGFIISGQEKKLLYIPDIDRWEEWDKDVVDALSGVDIAIIDGSFYSGGELPGRDMSKVPHPTIKTTMNMLKGRLDLKKTSVYFTHFNHTNPVFNSDDFIRKEIKNAGFHYAEQGMTFEI